jgi:UDP-3-O-acyl N-acetylglucosamine deacetylase
VGIEGWVRAPRRTALAGPGGRIDTVEHLLAAVVALELDDLDILVEGPEVPIADGSFDPFVALLQSAGVALIDAPGGHLALDGPLELSAGESGYAVYPAAALTVDVTLVYHQPVIGTQQVISAVHETGFVRDIACARTFGFRADIERAQRAGELLGATDGAGIALAADRVLNTALRWPDECVRHKAGDLIGDLALLGSRLRATVRATRPSHEGNMACVRAILAAAHFVEE